MLGALAEYLLLIRTCFLLIEHKTQQSGSAIEAELPGQQREGFRALHALISLQDTADALKLADHSLRSGMKMTACYLR